MRGSHLRRTAGSVAAALALLAAWNCSTDVSGFGAAGGGGDNGTGAEGGNFNPNGNGGSGTGGDDTCAQTESEATLTTKPVDIVFVVGNNGSLTQEIAAVEENINVNFAQIIEQSGVDYRVIVLSRSGAHQFNICVEAPLGGTADGECAGLDNNAQPANNPPTFYHYSIEVKQNDGWCKLLETFDGTLADEYAQQPAGWADWLREDAGQVFVAISDSGMNCTFDDSDLDDGPSSPKASDIPQAEASADAFDAYLSGALSSHFGDTDRSYTWHSVVGLEAKDPPTAAWLPSEPLALTKCSSEGTSPVSPALGQQAVSVLSGGLRFPICEWQNFDTIFKELAKGVVEGSAISCDLPLPDPPPGETLELATVEVAYLPGDGGEQLLSQVASPAMCHPAGFYFEGDFIKLCPEACNEVKQDEGAKLEVRFGCALEIE